MAPRRPPLRALLAGALLASLPALAAEPGGVTQDAAPPAEARQADPAPAALDAPLHPRFPLLDAEGRNVLESGAPVSPVRTCGQCHDADFIAAHNFHANAGLLSLGEPGSTDSGRAWDTGHGWFGRWNPILYRLLSPPGDPLQDLGIPGWLQVYGFRHPGGGPGTTARDGRPLAELEPGSGPDARVVDPATGESRPWDWSASGTAELDCFLCHTPGADHEARNAELQRGAFGWAATATLAGTGLVQRQGDGWAYEPEAFDANGLPLSLPAPQHPDDQACGQCHGLVQRGSEPLALGAPSEQQWETLTTGQVFSGQRMSASAVNLQGKDELHQPWDVHAARAVGCTDCHPALNDPARLRESDATRPDYLTFDPRRPELSDYLRRPLHEFAKGRSAQGSLAPGYAHTARDCQDCHDAEAAHADWLPFHERHMQVLSCTACHVPQVHAPALAEVDWTTLSPEGEPRRAYRGVQGDPASAASLVTGYEPVLLPRREADGELRLAPHNLVTAWYWVAGDPPRPVRLAELRRALLSGDGWAPELLSALDADGDGQLSDAERVLDTPEKVALVRSRLEGLGLSNPHVESEVQPYTVGHGVMGDGATRDCQDCHSDRSRVAAAMLLSARPPRGPTPRFPGDTDVELAGSFETHPDGSLWFQPALATTGHVLGDELGNWADLVGLLAVLGALLGVTGHGLLRYLGRRKYGAHQAPTRPAYLYPFYERLWHWVQAGSILLLLATGLVLHVPALATSSRFAWAVGVHNALAGLLVLNAVLAVFYYAATGRIREFVPNPRGFVGRAIRQAIFYTRGIFRGEPHPFEKTPEEKLNPLQQATYFGLLNFLLPAQIATGALILGAQHWPGLVERLGGLDLLLQLHTLIAWLFGAFVVAHVYLTTTGATLFASILGMITGWEEIEAPEAHEHEG